MDIWTHNSLNSMNIIQFTDYSVEKNSSSKERMIIRGIGMIKVISLITTTTVRRNKRILISKSCYHRYSNIKGSSLLKSSCLEIIIEISSLLLLRTITTTIVIIILSLNSLS